MNVAILGIKNLPAMAGADRVVEKLLEHLPAQNHYWVYVRKNGTATPRCHDNIHYVAVPALNGKHVGAFSYFFLCAMHCLVKGRTLDLAHVHQSDFGLFCALLRLGRLPMIGTFHGNPYERSKWGRGARLFLRLSERLFVELCDRLTSVSPQKSVARGLVQRKPVLTIPNGLDLDAGQGSSEGAFDFAAHGVESGRYLLFACGRLDPTKGLHRLLDAYQSGEYEDRLLVIGDFSHDRVYARQVEERCARDPRVVLIRRLLPKPALFAAVRGSRLFVFPSEVEAMSMMLLEVISCRTLVVCSRIAENVSVVGKDYPYLFDLDDQESLPQRLLAALREPRPEAIMDRLHARCCREYDWAQIASSYARVYEDLASCRPRHSQP